MDDQPSLIVRLFVIGLDIITAGVAEGTVPEQNRTEVFIGHIGGETQIILHTSCSFILVALSLFFVIDAFFFPENTCSSRPTDLLEFSISFVTMICGLAYVITIMVGKSAYLPVVVAASMFSILRAIRNITKGVRVGHFVRNRSAKSNMVAPEPVPQKERIAAPAGVPIAPAPIAPAGVPIAPVGIRRTQSMQDLELFWTGRFRRTPKKKILSPKFGSRQGPSALVMTDITAEKPNFVRKRRLSSLLHPGEILEDEYLITNLHKFKEQLSSWQFDVFDFKDQTKNSPLVTVTYVTLNCQFKVVQDFNVTSMTFLNFLHSIEEGYLDNAYHNSCHAADMTQAMAFLCFQGGLCEIMQMTSVEIMSIIIACACHDIAHPGVSNKFLRMTGDEMAIRYNDLHVLEQFSCALALGLLNKTENNFLASSPAATKRQFRKLFIDTVLATDLASHKELADKFNARLDGDGFVMSDPCQRLLVLKLMIKAVDISHPCREFSLHKKFTAYLEKELIKQGEQEEKAGLPVSVAPGRSPAAVAQSQIGFLQYMIKPFFVDVSRFLATGGNTFAKDTLMSNIDRNLAEWTRIKES